ncbi:S-adenosylmethionine decarboxylase [Fulvivirga sediminis]|uniref:S-adenosylmethionine decarboxylase n=1 Tax=Fulvivirga sediminis TaxID=2803949 RepID=A0A937FA20_9BACT|nr:S-adenosylmethionine decarboxylase [Fulvivirga sediminis]MBL3658460.1 S-adenosylmethionine decarboxylase [Fulvivirga sediminis]
MEHITPQHKSVTAHIYSLRLWIKTIEPEYLKETFDKLLSSTEFHVLNFSEYFFPVQGYTAIWLLAESHLAIHTFPQNGWCYIELSGCNKDKTNLFREQVGLMDFEIKWETPEMTESSPGDS